MKRTYEQRLEAKVDRFLAKLTVDSEIFGLVGRGFPGSFYKVYVRAGADSKRWWKFEWTASPSRIDPIEYQARIPVRGRATTIWAPITDLPDFVCSTARPALVKLMQRGAALRQTLPSEPPEQPE